ncbi:MAG: hypothetical protein JO257_31540 [Deltaproteobacteria bacterium]|nr:hypothetical protein [Deltaproteobacteria bacterium]
MTWNRREVLATLGVGAAHALLACSSPPRGPQRPAVYAADVRSWLHDAIARLHAAGFTHSRALAVTRVRTTTALDVMGAGISSARTDGVVLSTGTADYVTTDLSRAGIQAGVRALVDRTHAPAPLDFGPPPAVAREPHQLAEYELLDRVTALANRDQDLSSRIVYSAALLELDDAHVWAVAAGRDLEQRIQRVRKSITRVAWNGTRPVVSEVTRAWAGEADEHDLSDADLVAAREHALALMTPTSFPDGDHQVTLDPQLTAMLIDTAVRTLMTSTAARRPEVASRLAVGRRVAAPLLSLADDPLAPGVYGGFAFDDRGDAAVRTPLIDAGQVVGVLAPRTRAGHLGTLEAAPSHLILAPGTTPVATLLKDGFELEGALSATVDPSSDRVVIAAARARERKLGTRTGRIYADIELVGELSPLLAAVSAVSAETDTFGMRDEIDELPRFRSVTAPSIRTRGTLRARRRAT